MTVTPGSVTPGRGTPGPLTREWARVLELAAAMKSRTTRALFDADRQRFEHCSVEGAGLLLDFSRQRVDAEVLRALAALADAVDLRGAIAAMYRGDVVNVSESRAALHVALRQRAGEAVGGAAIAREVLAERERMLAFAEAVRGGRNRGGGGSSAGGAPASGERGLGEPGRCIETVVNLGIGGSDLGPAMAVEALRPFAAGAPCMVFVSNVDGSQIADALADADPATTLFIVASKTFTTQETLANARAARRWVSAALGEAAVPRHFAAVSVNAAAMDAFGVHPEFRFALWDWVGGRYSIWSSIGMSLAIAMGRERFLEFLDGGREMDAHFAAAPWLENLPALVALLGVWNANALGLPTLAVLPYDARLARFPAYLQQLEMESLGKSVTASGQPVSWTTGPIVWGEPGNNAQHSFFQLLHQGTPRAALDILLPARSAHSRGAGVRSGGGSGAGGDVSQHDLAIANALAQAEAFAFGHPHADAHRAHEGNRPVSLLAFESLDPRTLGRLIALYEHKVFAQSVLWGINAFDQWGVELGKRLCADLLPAVNGDRAAESAGVRALLARLRPWR